MAGLLEVKNLKTQFKTERGLVKAVDGISYHIDEQEIVGLVGESGCGKSVSQLSVMQLVPTPPGRIDGEVIFEGQDLLKLKADGDEMCSIRGGKMSMIFQEPMTALNPVLTISRQLTEVLELHLKMGKQTARERAIELLNLVGIQSPEENIDNYSYQFSGGMCQRVMIAMALSCNPKLLIADEPTTAMDVTIQMQVLELMKEMVAHFGSALLIVTHNLGVIARYAQRIYIMYAGRIVESGTSKDIFGDPRHPYTIGLFRCVPRLDRPLGGKLATIPGTLPDLAHMAPTCAFLPRCSHRTEKCEQEPWPELRLIEGQHYVSCYVDVRSKQDGPIAR